MTNQNSIPPQIIRQIFIILVILSLSGLIFVKLLPFLSGILGAITLYVILGGLMKYLTDRKKWNRIVAAAVSMFLSFICIVIPVGGAILMLGNKVKSAMENSEEVAKPLKEAMENLEDRYGFELSSSIDSSAITDWVSAHLQQWVGTTVNAIMAILLMYFLLYFMLIRQKQFQDIVCEYIPMNEENLDKIGSKTKAMVRANAIGIPLVGLAQGLVALIGFFIFGIEDPFFWFVILSLASMVPFVGTSLGMLPLFILTLSGGDTFAAWGILIYGFVVVGMTDNVTRLYFLKRLENVHPLVTLIGVMVGVPLFGFIGLIFGPLLVSLFIIIVQIYKQEYGKKSAFAHEEKL